MLATTVIKKVKADVALYGIGDEIANNKNNKPWPDQSQQHNFQEFACIHLFLPRGYTLSLKANTLRSEVKSEVETFRKIRGIENEKILTSISPVDPNSRAEHSSASHCGVHKINHNALFPFNLTATTMLCILQES